MILGKFLSRVILRVLLGSSAVVGQSMADEVTDETKFVDLREVLITNTNHPPKTVDTNKIEGGAGHHTATKGQSFKTVAEFHVISKDWPAISYMIGVAYDGMVYLLNYDDVLTYQASGVNTVSRAIVCLGNYSEVEATKELKEGFKTAVNYMRDKYDLKWFAMHTTIKMRVDGRYTECPGTNNYSWMKKYEFGLEHLDKYKRK